MRKLHKARSRGVSAGSGSQTRSNAQALLAMLSGGTPQSGADMARSLGITRAAVWKQIDGLRSRGLPVETVAGRGYRLPWPIEMLDASIIRAAIPGDVAGHVGMLDILWAPDSTSDALHRRRVSSLPDFSVLLAESQTAGRGRRGRSWLSPPGLNIYLSMYKQFDTGVPGLSGLSLAVGVMLMRALDDAGIHACGLKWPNDVLSVDAKLGGVLLDLDGEYAGPCSVIAGVGINLRLPTAVRSLAQQPVTDLAELCAGEPPSRNRFAAQVIAQMMRGLAQFEQHGFAAFAAEFDRHDVLKGRQISVNGAHGTTTGRGAGVDARGALLLETEDGCQVIESAEVSITQFRRSVS